LYLGVKGHEISNIISNNSEKYTYTYINIFMERENYKANSELNWFIWAKVSGN
jgi:hypothetical protein